MVSLGDSVRALGMNEGSVVAVSFEVPPECKVEFVEHVEAVVSVEHPRRGEVEVVLISWFMSPISSGETRPKFVFFPAREGGSESDTINDAAFHR